MTSTDRPGRPLRVGVDARSLEEQRTGIGRYLHNVLREAARLRPDWRFVLYTIGPPQPDLEAPCFKPRRVAFEAPDQTDLFEAELRRDPPDVFFSPLYDLPRPIEVPCVITVHDMVHEATPEAFTDVQLAYLRERHAYALRRADRVITDSEFAKREIESRFLGVDPIVIPLAGDPRFTPEVDGGQEAMRVREGLGMRTQVTDPYATAHQVGGYPPYHLYVGSIARKRHVEEMVRAWLSTALRSWNHRLVVIGRNHLPDPEPLEALLTDPSIVRRDWVSDDVLVPLYRGASAFVYLSTYEGFGMPPLEAMACGVPVVAARAASIPEVVGDAALLVDDPRDVKEVATAIERIYLDQDLRSVLRQRGFTRAAQFSWHETARRTLDVIEGVGTREST